MQEPATSTGVLITASITGGLIAAFGPVIGGWLAVVLSAVAGAMWTVGKMTTNGRAMGFFALCRIVLTAVVLTGGISLFISEHIGGTQSYILPGVAFLIGALGDKFEDLKGALVDRLKSLIGGGRFNG